MKRLTNLLVLLLAFSALYLWFNPHAFFSVLPGRGNYTPWGSNDPGRAYYNNHRAFLSDGYVTAFPDVRHPIGESGPVPMLDAAFVLVGERRFRLIFSGSTITEVASDREGGVFIALYSVSSQLNDLVHCRFDNAQPVCEPVLAGRSSVRPFAAIDRRHVIVADRKTVSVTQKGQAIDREFGLLIVDRQSRTEHRLDVQPMDYPWLKDIAIFDDRVHLLVERFSGRVCSKISVLETPLSQLASAGDLEVRLSDILDACADEHKGSGFRPSIFKVQLDGAANELVMLGLGWGAGQTYECYLRMPKSGGAISSYCKDGLPFVTASAHGKGTDLFKYNAKTVVLRKSGASADIPLVSNGEPVDRYVDIVISDRSN